MSLTLVLVLEQACGLRTKPAWKFWQQQRPFCIITCGDKTARSRTDYLRCDNPVWNQVFRFCITPSSQDDEVSLTFCSEVTGLIATGELSSQRRDTNLSGPDPELILGTAQIKISQACQRGGVRLRIPISSKQMSSKPAYVTVAMQLSTSQARPSAPGPAIPNNLDRGNPTPETSRFADRVSDPSASSPPRNSDLMSRLTDPGISAPHDYADQHPITKPPTAAFSSSCSVSRTCMQTQGSGAMPAGYWTALSAVMGPRMHRLVQDPSREADRQRNHHGNAMQ